MRRSIHLWQGKGLLHRWKVCLHGKEELTKEEVLQLMQETAKEAQSSENKREKSLLGKRTHSMLIWKALEKYNISWSNCLKLIEAQLHALPLAQRKFIEDGLKDVESWHSLPHTMVELWHFEEDLSSVYSRLLEARTIVQFASLLHAAVGERPQLGGILPVTPEVLLRCYELGKDQPEVALQCCQILALANAEVVSRLKKETLAFAYAMLHAERGQWSVALSVLNATREVRPSAKRLFWVHAFRLNQWKVALTTVNSMQPKEVADAITYAPHWLCALRTFERWNSPESAQALLTRADYIQNVGWEKALSLCAANRVYAYSVLRPIIASIPNKHPQRMQLYADAIAPSSESMYAGTLTRRAYKYVQNGEWEQAIGLLCGCRYYDVVLPLVPYASRGAALPHELLSYEEAVHRIKISHHSMRAVTFEEQLAIALHGDWTQLQNVKENARLRSLLLACRANHISCTKKTEENEGIQCFMFQNEKFSKLVCLAADKKAQRYYIQVIPRALRQHHFGTLRISENESTNDEDYLKFLSSDYIISKGEECNTLCAMVVQYLRKGGELMAHTFFREIARCLAMGKISLKAADRYELSLAVLKSAKYFHRMDSATTARMALSIPTQHLTTNTDALEISINGLILNGQWERAISLFQRVNQPYPEFFTNLVYVTPSSVSRKVLKLLWKDNLESRWVLLVQDLFHGDTRLAQDELKSFNSQIKGFRIQKQVQQRRRVLGACCALIKTSQSMHSLVRSANISSFSSLDVDEHGLQRLLQVLSWEQALTALSDLVENGEIVEEHWAILVCGKPSVSLEAVKKVVSYCPYSPLLHAVLIHKEAIENNDLLTSVKALLRFQTLVFTEYKAYMGYLRPFVLFLKDVLQHFPDEFWKNDSLWSIVRRIFNQTVENDKFSFIAREGRKGIPMPLRKEGGLAALFIIGFVYQALSRVLQFPISASITSRLLRSAALNTSDSQSALYFFKSLRKPTDYERSLLVFALRNNEDAMTILLNTGRFVRPRPDQVLLWSDQQLGEERWRVAIELLSESPPQQDLLVKLCAGWTWAENLRTLELLRRTHGNSSLAAPYVKLVKDLQKKNKH
ncbi:uncharacterized protein TM35_000016570 [Trypanosoma theileri]|uniref:Uncharacterized protein n=1 Tax=Trypanosoma theileri TaxID=67003 RepID=A0A1X0PBF4_9TRYP|nr:uncharacterized protein TM35_000016570 [Trypanosoma theileri]ORC93780.1 hypothetical protein TM35_000016570 [Trypanosoma theileri]